MISFGVTKQVCQSRDIRILRLQLSLRGSSSTYLGHTRRFLHRFTHMLKRDNSQSHVIEIIREADALSIEIIPMISTFYQAVWANLERAER